MRATLVASLCIVCIARAPVFLLGALAGEHELGLFAAAQRYAMVATIVSGALSTVLAPRAAAVRTAAQADAYLRGGLPLAAAFVAPIAALALIADVLLPALLGADFAPAAPAARTMLGGFVLGTAVGPIAATFPALGAARVLACTHVAQLALVIAIGAIAIPSHGVLGAAWSLAAAHVCGVLVIVLVWRRLRRALP